MHLLFVTLAFPTPESPFAGSFLGEQVRALSDHVERITVLSPTTYVPTFMRRFSRVAHQASLPARYQMIPGRCDVLFPRYVKAPGYLFHRWTMVQWCRIVSQTITRLAESCPVSIIHANAGSVSSWASISVAKQFRLPCVVTYQGSEVNKILVNHQKGWKLCRDSFRYADANISVSKQIERTLKQYAQPRGRCEVLLRGVDQTQFFPAPTLTKDPTVLFVGRLEKAKGIFDLIQAWKKVRSACPDALLWVLGPDQSNGRVLNLAKSLEIQDRIKFLGVVPPSGVARLMRQSRVLCLPSYTEGTPNSVMEALSSGLPVVSTRVGGIPDIVHEKVTGLLVEPGDIVGLADALTYLLVNPSQCIRMGQAAQGFAQEFLDIQKTATHLVDVYHQLIK